MSSVNSVILNDNVKTGDAVGRETFGVSQKELQRIGVVILGCTEVS